MKKFLNEFKEFAMKGNVVDMAVGVIIGAAFGKIVTSLVNDIIMPAIGMLTGGVNFSDHKWVIQQAQTVGEEIVTPEVAITWGAFVQTIFDFIIIAFCIFVAIKFINKLKRSRACSCRTRRSGRSYSGRTSHRNPRPAPQAG